MDRIRERISFVVGLRELAQPVHRQTHFLNGRLKVVPQSGFILGRLRSLQMRIIGIWRVRLDKVVYPPWSS